MARQILQINYTFHVSAAEYTEANAPYGSVIAAVPGVAWKIWLLNETTHEAGGIYLFEDEETMQAFIDGPIVAGLRTMDVLSDLSIKSFSVMEKLTAETRGPLSGSNGRKTFNRMADEAFASVPTVKPAELRQWLEQEPRPLVIDVQDAADVAQQGLIPGAVNISFGSLTYKADHELPDAWRDPRLHDYAALIVATCGMGPLGAIGAKLLKDMGFTNVYILEGGVQAWIEAGYPTLQLKPAA